MSIDLEKAVGILEKSTRVLFLTGAGMSADSGIPTFRDQDGFWRNFPIYQRSGLAPEELANATRFMRHPEQSWGFYEWRRRNAARNHPHAGYAVINALIQRYDGFVQTTNTDGYHLRSGISADRVYEIHGSMWRLQCLDGHRDLVWDNTQVPLCELDEESMLVAPESIPRFQEHQLRPNILMFGDCWYVPNTDQMHNIGKFLEHPLDAVLLIGSDCGVPTNVRFAAQYQRRGARVICINLSPDSCGGHLQPDVHLLARAEEGLTRLADLLKTA